MLKKVSKIVTLACLLAFAGNSFAQTAETPEYPQYGFWSNWGIGVTGSFNFQPDVKHVLLQKEVERGAWLRFHWNYTDLANCDRDTTHTLGEAGRSWRIANDSATMDKHMAFTGEFEAQATGIEEVRCKKEEVRSDIFNLQGQRISSLQKGLNIVNGQKVFVK